MRLNRLLPSALLLTACQDAPEATDLKGPETRADRTWIPATFDTLWITGGPAEDSLLGLPSHLASVGDLIIVSDPGYNRVLALSAKDGRPVWVVGGIGQPKVRLEKPLSLAILGASAVVVADDRLNTLTTLDRNGRVLGSTDVPTGIVVNSTCALSGGQVLIATAREGGPVFATDPGDGMRSRVTIPISIPEVAGQNPLVLQGQLAVRSDRTACAMALEFGNWIMLTDGRTMLQSARLREEVKVPRVISSESRRETADGYELTLVSKMEGSPSVAAMTLSAVQGRIRVLYGGRTPDAMRILDDYHDATLEYLGSVRLPFFAASMTTPSSDVVVAITQRDGYPLIIAVRERRAQ